MNEPQITISFKNVRDAFYVYYDIIKRHGKGATDTPIASFYIANSSAVIAELFLILGLYSCHT